MRNIKFTDFDKFKRKEFADRLTTALIKFSPFQNEAYVLSLNARFGSGKTTFLEMWKNELEGESHKVVYINAWETDFDNEPLIPILSSLLEAIGGAENTLKNALQGVLGAAALMSSQFAEHVTGINSNDTVERFRNEMNQENLQKIGQEIYKEYDFKQRAYQTLKLKLEKYVDDLPDNKLLIILVDELDRARPDYSVRFLEAIKHIFPIKGLCFVIAIDRRQLEMSVRQLYGDIDFDNYYRRFVTHEAKLSEITKVNLVPFLTQLAVEFIDSKKQVGIKFPFQDQDVNPILEFMEIVCRIFNFVPRQIENLFRVFSQLMSVSSDTMARPNWIRASILLIAFYIYDSELYIKIGEGKLAPMELRDIIKKLNFKSGDYNNREDYIMNIAMAFSLEEGKNLNDIADVISEYRDFEGQTVELKRANIINMLAKSVDDFARVPRTSTFNYIYGLIEEWKAFLE